jgi:hypothetical protein
MPPSGTGNAPDSVKGRVRLTVRDPLIESLVAGLTEENLEELRAFCKVWVGRRNRWDIGRRSGLFGAKLLRRDDADRALKQELAKLVGVVA